MRAVSYTRVSTEGQATEGVSLDAQAEAIRRYAAYKGMEIIGEIVDAGISGGLNAKRPGFIRLLDMVVTGETDAVIVFSLERLSRDAKTLFCLEDLLDDSHVELHSIEGQIDTSTPDGFLQFAMKAVFGEYERRQTKHRTKKALRHKKDKGQVIGSIPYGYARIGNNLIPVANEQGLVAIARALHAQGYKLGHITTALNTEGHLTRTGKPWDAKQVRRILADYEATYAKGKTKLSEKRAAQVAYIKVAA